MGPQELNTEEEKNEQQHFYGVYFPHSDLSPLGESSDDNRRVFTDKKEALKALKNSKKARFKAFTNEEDALEFSMKGQDMDIKSPMTPAAGNEGFLPSFKTPKDLPQFRRLIEQKDLPTVTHFVRENPRYLVSIADTPTILQEGSRYNALHICARSDSASICAFILEKITSLDFMKTTYGPSSVKNLRERSDVLLDLYLNTPDKNANETPLHYASKMGSLEVVKVLVSYKECDKNIVNKYGKTARDIVCSRVEGTSKTCKNDILFALDGHFYVPVLRSDDVSVQPMIGAAFSPTSPDFTNLSPNNNNNNNDDIASSSITSPVRIRAFAGPMTQNEAVKFRKLWKTPPRNHVTSPRASLYDYEKGLESVGRTLASQMHVPWKEFWPFLNAFADLTSIEGLELLEQHIGLKLTHTMDQSHQISKTNAPVVSPITDLCNNFETLTIKDNNVAFVPWICIEKSCFVFAHRIVTVLFANPSSLATELSHFELFLSSCAADSKFRNCDISLVHCRLGSIIASKMKSKKDCTEVSVTKTITDILSRGEKPIIRCVFNWALRFFEGDLSESDILPCNCKIASVPRKLSSRRNIFIDSSEVEQDVPPTPVTNNSPTESDEDIFFTPPSSPSIFSNPNDNFVEPDEIPEVYLGDSDKFSDLDAKVLSLLSNISLDRNKYPFITYWQSLCSNRNDFESKVSTPFKRRQFPEVDLSSTTS